MEFSAIVEGENLVKGLNVKLSVMCLGLMLLLGFWSNSPNFSILKVKAIGNPDSYGNVIQWLAIYQWNTTHYVLLQNVTTSTNWEQRVNPVLAINFTISIRLNITLASDNSEAIANSRVLCNISNGGSQWLNEEFNHTSISSDANYYYLTEEGHWNQTGLPVSGTDYTVVTRYDAYY